MDERPKCEKQAYHVKKRYCKKISLWQREEKEFLKEHSKYTNFKAKKKGDKYECAKIKDEHRQSQRRDRLGHVEFVMSGIKKGLVCNKWGTQQGKCMSLSKIMD